MESKTRRRVRTLIVAGAVAGGLATAAVPAVAATATGGSTSVASVCAKAHGKYAPRLVAHYKITGGDESVHGVPGGTLQVWASDSCQTIWVKTVKLKKYSNRPLFTVAAISFSDKPHHKVTKRAEKTTRSSVETPAVHNPSTRSGTFRVEGGFVGPYQFDSVHTYRY
ncbi:hypothetical protein AB0L00_10215 [Actinoallomurus sp. NPDC052308]|uniref:hypothetical protein n=1 Tax=Actinoallomurus sp. NPDC052308 TaxID=3155530 RepID=UPI00343EF6B9